MNLMELISERSGIAIDKLSRDSRLDDLGIDSLDTLDLLNEIERTFSVKLRDPERLETLGDLFDLAGVL